MAGKIRVCPKCGHIGNQYTYFCTACGAGTDEWDEESVRVRKTDENKTKKMFTVVENRAASNGKSEETVKGKKDGNSDEEWRKKKRRYAIILLAIVILAFFSPFILILSDKKDSVSVSPIHAEIGRSEQNRESVPERYEEKEEGFGEPETAEDAMETDGAPETVSRYELVVEDVSWSEAFDACLKKGGHLVRIETKEEFSDILQLIQKQEQNNIMFWIAGARNRSDKRYRWVHEDLKFGKEILNKDREYLDYWMEEEPSFVNEDTGATEDSINMFYRESEQRWVWDDVPNDILDTADFYAGKIGYICEFEYESIITDHS